MTGNAERLAAEMQRCFDGKDAALFASLFAVDASFVTIDGELLTGRSAIEATHELMFVRLAPAPFLAAVRATTIVSERVEVCHIDWSFGDPATTGLLTLTLVGGTDALIASAANVARTASDR